MKKKSFKLCYKTFISIKFLISSFLSVLFFFVIGCVLSNKAFHIKVLSDFLPEQVLKIKLNVTNFVNT